MFTWDPHAPYEEHQDHRSVAWAATEAAAFSHFPLYHPEHRDEGLEPHYVGEKYWFAKVPRDVNKTVDISDYIDRKIDALCAHECQMEMTVMDLQVRWRPPGWTFRSWRDADPKDYRPVIEAQIKAWAGSVGRRGRVRSTARSSGGRDSAAWSAGGGSSGRSCRTKSRRALKSDFGA